MSGTSWLIDAVVGLLLVTSGALSIIAAIGLARLQDYFTRMHAPALASTGGVWCVTAATIVHFSAREGEAAPEAILVGILMAITAPVTTVLLARTGLFRKRLAGKDVPAPLGGDPRA
jgi:multicomponent K+:H+ antiporter subunit G